jgi:hypothetical protein
VGRWLRGAGSLPRHGFLRHVWRGGRPDGVFLGRKLESCRNEDSDDSDEGASEAITILSPELRWELLRAVWTQTKKTERNGNNAQSNVLDVAQNIRVCRAWASCSSPFQVVSRGRIFQ